MTARRLSLDVYGRRVDVEATATGWAAFLPGVDGKRRPADFWIPAELDEEGVVRYLDDLFHESATTEHPTVSIL